jgi:hypothetical protein
MIFPEVEISTDVITGLHPVIPLRRARCPLYRDCRVGSAKTRFALLPGNDEQPNASA